MPLRILMELSNLIRSEMKENALNDTKEDILQ